MPTPESVLKSLKIKLLNWELKFLDDYQQLMDHN